MYAYKIILNDGEEMNFTSIHHAGMMQVLHINGAQMLWFEDAQTAINLIHVDFMWVNDKLYKLQAYVT